MNCQMKKLMRVMGVLTRCNSVKYMSGLPDDLIQELRHYDIHLNQLVLEKTGLNGDTDLRGILDKLLAVCHRFSHVPLCKIIARKLGELFESDLDLYMTTGKTMHDIYFVGEIVPDKVNIITGYLTPEKPFGAYTSGKKVFKARAPLKTQTLYENHTRPVTFLSNEVTDVKPVSRMEDFDHLVVREHLLSGR